MHDAPDTNASTRRLLNKAMNRSRYSGESPEYLDRFTILEESLARHQEDHAPYGLLMA
jgi:hypothetical protein